MRFPEFQRYRPKPDQNVFVFICGDELLLAESRAVWAAGFGSHWAVVKLHVKEFEEIESSRLHDDALTPSLFAESRAYMVTNAEKLTKGRLEDLAGLQGIVNASVKVILVISPGRGNEALIRTFTTVGIDEIKAPDAARWLVDRYRVGPELARYLVDIVGTNLCDLHNEMEKLQTYTGNALPIETSDIDALTLRSDLFSPYALGDAVIARDYRKAISVAEAMIGEDEEPLAILGIVARVWRQLFIGKSLVGNVGAVEAAMAASVPSFKAGEFAAGCKKYEWKQLARGFRELLQADRAFKTTSPDPANYFDMLLWKLTR